MDAAQSEHALTGATTIEIVGTPVACAEGAKDTWRHLAQMAARQLHHVYGEAAEVRYYDLFDTDCPRLPAGAQLPLVLVNGEALSAGAGKISVPAIKVRLAELGLRPTAAR